MKYILGTKEYMTQIFDEEGVAHAATIVSAGPVVVLQVKTVETDGYNAVQVGYGVASEKKTNKAQKGHGKGVGYKQYAEFRVSDEDVKKFEVGATIDASVFAEGDAVVVTGTSKGKGFQGVVKRHGFHGGRRSHGQKHSEREPGSIGPGGLQRVAKGIRMAGRMGNDTVSVKGITVIGVMPEEQKLIISGALPGRRGSLLSIKSA